MAVEVLTTQCDKQCPIGQGIQQQPGVVDQDADVSKLQTLDLGEQTGDAVQIGLDAEVRGRRAEAEAEEEAISYVRRVLQGRLDILRAELRHREQADNAAAGDLLAQLSSVLSDHAAGERDVLGSRATRLRVPSGTEPHERRLDEVVGGASFDDLSHLDVATLEGFVERLGQHEAELSRIRRQLFERIDALRSELAARYKDGRAVISDLLAET